MKSAGLVCRVVVVTLGLLAPAPVLAQAKHQQFTGDYPRLQIPEMLTYDELVTLSKPEPIPPALQARLDALTHTPFISNEAFYRGARPVVPNARRLGRGMRVVFWNIERGMELDDIKLLFTDREAYIRKVSRARFDKKYAHVPEVLRPRPGGELELEADARNSYARLRAQIVALQRADVILLNEVDWGVPRTKYREVVRELGHALNMNWVYGVEFLEIDPKVIGTETFAEVPDPVHRAALERLYSVDKTRLRALHGSAILSRYPIRSASTKPFDVKGYDWFTGEGHLPVPERLLRSMSGVFAGDKLLREMRRGGRTMVRANLDVPDLPRGELTVITPHLENRAKASDRKLQMAEVLDSIKSVDHPVIIAGDFNSNGSNLAPESFLRLGRLLFTVDGLAEMAMRFATPFGLAYSALHWGVNALHSQGDPTSANVPLLGENPERGLFTLLRDFRFDDGGAFDFRGDLERTHDGAHGGTLANSNERSGKGFHSTFEIGTHVGPLGKYKLDWILVKSYLKDPHDPAGSYRFAPHGGWTLRHLNVTAPTRLSDHHPIVAFLPFAEPTVPRLKAVKASVEATDEASSLDLSTFTCGEYDRLRTRDLGAAEIRSVWGHGYRAGFWKSGTALPPITWELVDAHVKQRASTCTGPKDLWITALGRLGPIAPLAKAQATSAHDVRPASYTCREFVALKDDDLGVYQAQVVWAHGYASGLAKVGAEEPAVTVSQLFAFSDALLATCRAQPDQLWMLAVSATARRH